MPNTYYGGSCDECGARVQLVNRRLHNEWHAKMDELIDWAQAVSKLFTSPQEEDHQHKGTPLQPNSGWD